MLGNDHKTLPNSLSIFWIKILKSGLLFMQENETPPIFSNSKIFPKIEFDQVQSLLLSNLTNGVFVVLTANVIFPILDKPNVD